MSEREISYLLLFEGPRKQLVAKNLRMHYGDSPEEVEARMGFDATCREAWASFTGDNIDRLPYDVGYRCDPDEAFSVPQELPPYLVPLRDAPDAVETATHDEMTSGLAQAIVAVEDLRTGPVAFFRLSKHYKIGPRRFLIFNREGAVPTQDVSAILPESPSVVWAADCALFRCESAAAYFFKVEAAIRANPAAAVSKFMQTPLLVFEDKQGFQESLGPQLRRLAHIAADRNLVGRVDLAKVIAYAAEREVELEIRKIDGVDRIVVPSDAKSAKKLLKFLGQSMVKCPMTDDAIEANSTRVIAHGDGSPVVARN